MKRHCTILSLTVATVIFFSCNNNNSTENDNHSSSVSIDSIGSNEIQNDSLDNVVRSIIDISATDFYKHQQPVPIDFRNVEIRLTIKENGEKLYVLCGQFLTHTKENKDDWIQFATIKNSEYEQWVGPNALTYCENSKEISYTKTDLSSALKQQFDLLQK
jgi:hypothetical protein